MGRKKSVHQKSKYSTKVGKVVIPKSEPPQVHNYYINITNHNNPSPPPKKEGLLKTLLPWVKLAFEAIKTFLLIP